MVSWYRIVEIATTPALKIALGIGGAIAVAAWWLGLIDQQTASTYIYLYLSYLGVNMGHSEYKARLMEKEVGR